jgi:hypothetical protein
MDENALAQSLSCKIECINFLKIYWSCASKSHIANDSMQGHKRLQITRIIFQTYFITKSFAESK